MDNKMWHKIFRENALSETITRDEFPKEKIKNIANLVQHNNHTEAYIEIAKVIGDKKLIADLEKVQQDHERAGHLTQELQSKRNVLYKKMIKLAKAQFTNFKDINRSL